MDLTPEPTVTLIFAEQRRNIPVMQVGYGHVPRAIIKITAWVGFVCQTFCSRRRLDVFGLARRDPDVDLEAPVSFRSWSRLRG